MEFKLIPSYKKAHEATGITVVIDVLRACTTICYAFGSGVREIIPVAELGDAYALKKKYPNAYVLGEREGKKVDGCDFGNSPTEISCANLTGKMLIMTTSAGTQGMVRAVHASEIITGAFVNAQAIVDYLLQKNPHTVSFLMTDDRWSDNEDALFAEFIVDRLEGKNPDFQPIYTHLLDHPGSAVFLKTPLYPTSRSDFENSMKVDLFPFVVRAEKREGILTLNKILSNGNN